MNLQEPLTKETFWNEMMSKYPNATKAFCDWIDEYKRDVFWVLLFGDNIKFHDLPHAMQQGIWLEYLCQLGGCEFLIEDFFEWDLKEDIEELFKMQQEEKSIIDEFEPL